MSDDRSQKYAAARHYFGGVAASYENRRAHKPKWSEETRLVESYVSRLAPGASVLDVPFGTGRFALLYVAAGLAVAGVDISADMIAEARQRHGGTIAGFDLRTAPAEQLPFADRSFDYLICNRFIKWLPSEAMVAAVATEFRRVCRKEMLIQVKLTGSPVASLMASLSRLISRPFRKDDSKRPTARYTMRQLERCFEAGGWTISEVVDASKVGRGVKYLVLRQG